MREKKRGGQEDVKKVPKQVTIHGIVTPYDWDEEGNIIALTISALNEEEYLIDRNTKGKELIKHLHKQVRVTGQPVKRRGNKAIKVDWYELVPSPYEDSEA